MATATVVASARAALAATVKAVAVASAAMGKVVARAVVVAKEKDAAKAVARASAMVAALATAMEEGWGREAALAADLGTVLAVALSTELELPRGAEALAPLAEMVAGMESSDRRHGCGRQFGRRSLPLGYRIDCKCGRVASRRSDSLARTGTWPCRPPRWHPLRPIPHSSHAGKTRCPHASCRTGGVEAPARLAVVAMAAVAAARQARRCMGTSAPGCQLWSSSCWLCTTPRRGSSSIP